jgi:hypothetical protein
MKRERQASLQPGHADRWQQMVHRMRSKQGNAQRAQIRNGCFAPGDCLQAFARQPVQAHRQGEVPSVTGQAFGSPQPSERICLALACADGCTQVRVFG